MATLSERARALLADPSKYHAETGIPILKAHTMYVRDPETGKLTDEVKYTVTDADLEEIARNSNESVEAAGHLPRQTIGHTATGKLAEIDQPAVLIGAAINYRVATEGKTKYLVADLYTRNDRWDRAQEFPYRSAEYNWGSKKIRGVARILRDPYLELGTTLYEDDDSTVCYAEPVMPDPKKKAGEEKPAKAGNPAAGDAKPALGQPGAKKPAEGKPGEAKPGEGKPPEVASTGMSLKQVFGDLNPDEVLAADRLIEYVKAAYPAASNLFAAKAGIIPDQTPPPADGGEGRAKAESEAAEAEANGAGKPGETSANPKNSPPGSGDDSEDEDDMPTDAKLQAENDLLKIERELDKLELVEHLQFDREGETEILVGMTPEKRVKRYESIRKNARKAPNAGGKVQVLQDGPKEGEEDDDTSISVAKDKMTLEQYQDAMIAVQGVTPGEPRMTAWEKHVNQSAATKRAKS